MNVDVSVKARVLTHKIMTFFSMDLIGSLDILSILLVLILLSLKHEVNYTNFDVYLSRPDFKINVIIA